MFGSKIANVDNVETKIIVNQIIDEYKLAEKEYKTRHDCVEKVINWELCNRFKNLPYYQMGCVKSFLKNVMNTIFWDFKIQADH